MDLFLAAGLKEDPILLLLGSTGSNLGVGIFCLLGFLFV